MTGLIKDRLNEVEVSAELWGMWKDWKWQLRHSITTIDRVEEILDIEFPEEKRRDIERTIEKFPMSITPYYLSLVDAEDYENDPIFRQAFPDSRELSLSECDMEDPLHEDADSPVPGLTHRYPDRVLVYVSHACSMYCRHCTRKRKVGDVGSIPSREMISRAVDDKFFIVFR